MTINPEEEEILSQHLTGCEGWEIVLWSAGARDLATLSAFDECEGWELVFWSAGTRGLAINTKK